VSTPGATRPADAGTKPEVRVLQHMARTGGTAISKCLAVMDSVVLLSEIHPLAVQLHDPVAQARDWFGLFTPAEAEPLAGGQGPFDEVIGEIVRRCEARGDRLVLREWSHIDFTAVPYPFAATYYPLMVGLLERRFRVIRTATVRHPVDQWLSLSTRKVMQNTGFTLTAFLQGYRRFADEAAEIGFVRYEDFTADPDTALKTLCSRLEIPFDPGYRERWSDYPHVTGEPKPRETIGARPRPPVSPALLEAFAADPNYRAAIERLGYRHGA
jgi:hypothetical protein